LLVIALAACDEHGQSPGDGGGDGGGSDGGGECAKTSFVMGELIDWDSTEASFLGVNGAAIALTLDESFGTVTPPNGRLDFCARPDLPLEFVVDAPGDYLDGTLSIDRDVLLQSGATPSVRTLTATRAASFFTERGLTFDPNAAQIVVLSIFDASTMSIDLAHDTAQAGNDDGVGGFAWANGDAGRYVLFPNVVVTGSTATVTGDLMTGPRIVPVAAGKLTLFVMSFVFVGP
jgi:hypothetical protein